ADKKGKILIVNAVKDVKQEKSISFLEKKHIDKIYQTYINFESIEGYAIIVDKEVVLERKASLNIAQYVSNVDDTIGQITFRETILNWEEASDHLKLSMKAL